MYYIPPARCKSLIASVFVSNPSDASSVHRPPPTHLSLLMSNQDRIPLPTPPPLLSIDCERKRIATSSVRDVHWGTSSLLLPLLTHPLSLLSPRNHLPLSTPPLFLLIFQACCRDATAYVIVPESLPPLLLSWIPQMCSLFLNYRQVLEPVFLFRR